jgi:hypothetical protein
MAFVARNFYSVLETSFRWECSQTEIVELAMAEKIDLVIALPNVRFDDGTEARMGVIEGGAVRPLFRGYGLLEEHVFIRQARPANCGWKRIEEPREGIRVMAPDVLITAAEVERFEDENNLVRRVVSGPGAQSRYDWEGFYCEIICRVHNNGLACCWFRGHEDKIVTKELESGYDETEVQPRVQDRGGKVGDGSGCGGGASRP